MNNLEGRLVIYLVGVACIFIIMFGIRASAYIINPILLAAVITITVLPVPGRLERREAAKHVKGLWGRVKETFSSDDKAEDVVEEPETA